MKKTYLAIGLLVLIVPTLVLASLMSQHSRPSEEARIAFGTGNVYAQVNDYATAAKEYSKAVELAPDYAEALSNLAVSYNKLEKYQDASEVLQKLIALEPENPNHHYDYAVNLVLQMKKTGNGSIGIVEESLAHLHKVDELSFGMMNVKENIAFLEDLKEQYYAKQT